MNGLPSKVELLAFQARWIRRAGAAALLGAFIVTVGIVLQRAGLHIPSGNSDAEQLTFAHAHSGRVILSSVVQAIGFVLFGVPLLFLFQSARLRAERVRRGFVGLIVLGPLAFGAGLAISSVGSTQAADKFVSQAPAVERQARAEAQAAATAAANPVKQGATGAKSGGAKGSTPATTSTAGPTTSTGTTTGTTTSPAPPAAAATPKTPDQAASDARESLADHLNRHTTLLVAGGLISTVGVLALVFGMVYTALWCMRLGLLSRFWGALGMAFGLFLIIPVFPPVPGLVLWFAAIGLMFLGVWPRPLPPAWAAGEAMPWPRPGDDIGPPPDRSDLGGTVEGSGREVSEPPLPEAGASSTEPGEFPDLPPSETQGQRRRKRKRRR